MKDNNDLEFLIEILSNDKPSELIKRNEEKIFELIPELFVCKGFNQNNIWHIYDVYEHILHVVDGVDNNLILRMVALFHDVGKPFVYTEDENGIGHFYNHWNKSKEIFLEFIGGCAINKYFINIVSNLILYHDLNIDKLNDEEIVDLINILGKDGIDMLFNLKQSDLLAQNSEFHYLLDNYREQKTKIFNLIK